MIDKLTNGEPQITTMDEDMQQTKEYLIKKIFQNMNSGGFWLNCKDIEEIELTSNKTVGKGTRRNTYLGNYKGEKVAVKIIGASVQAAGKCLRLDRKVVPIEECYHLAHMSAMKEMLLLSELRHPNIIKLLGYCVRDTKPPRKEDRPLQHGVIAVYEYAEKYNPRDLSLRERLDYVLQMCDMLHYFQHSPLGSLRITDFRKDNVMVVDGRLKASDFDLLNAFEYKCSPSKKCLYGVECQNGVCEGLNAIRMMKKAYNDFFDHLLTDLHDRHGLSDVLTEIKRKIKQEQYNAHSLKLEIQDLMTKFHEKIDVPSKVTFKSLTTTTISSTSTTAMKRSKNMQRNDNSTTSTTTTMTTTSPSGEDSETTTTTSSS